MMKAPHLLVAKANNSYKYSKREYNMNL